MDNNSTVTRSSIDRLKIEQKKLLRQLKIRHTSEINELSSKNNKEESELKKIRDRQEKELSELKRQQHEEIASLEEELLQKIVILKKQYQTLKTENKLKIMEYRKRINELEEEKEKQLKETKEKIDEELDTKKKDLEDEQLKREVNQGYRRLDKLKGEFNEKVNQLKYELNGILLEERKKKYEVYHSKLSLKTPLVNALLSAFIWGLGQFRNRQLVKGLVFLMFQILFFAIEFLSGKYLSYLTGRLTTFDIRDAGLFLKGFWGVVTLGTREDVWSGIRLIHGDRSNILLINGLISVLVLVIFIGLYIYNILDAYKTSKKQIETMKVLSTREYLSELWENSFEYIVILPALILMIFFSIMPILFGLLVAFTNYGGRRLLLFDWVGFSNFGLLLNFSKSGTGWGYTFLQISKWTIIFAFFATFTCFFGGLFQAIILNNKRVVGRKIWRTIIILPWAIPQLVLLLVINNVFNSQFGLLNNYLREWGLMARFREWGITNQAGMIGWFDDQERPIIAQVTVIFVNLFLGMPYFMALMTGIMTSIDREMYEAADIDGANANQKFWRITLPIVLYMTAPLLIMSLASNLNNFGLIYFLTGGGPGNVNFAGNAGSTDILISWIYKLTTDSGTPLYNMASVFSIIIFIIIGSFSAWNFTRTKAFKEEDMV